LPQFARRFGNVDDLALRQAVVNEEAAPALVPPLRPVPLSRNRDFVLLWTGQAVSVFGTRVAAIAYPLLVLSLTGSPAKVGLVSFANWIPAVLFGLPAGALVDRWNRKRVMIWCDLGRAAALGSIVAALAAGVLTFPQILAIAFLDRALGVFFNPAEISALRRVVPADQLTTAIARNESREYSAFLLGPPVGGALFALTRAAPFLADAVSYCVSVVGLLLIKTEFQDRPLARRSLRHEVADGLAHLWRESFLRTTVLLEAGGNFVSNGVALTAIIVARQSFGASPTVVGLMLMIGGIGGLVGSLLAPLVQPRLHPRLIVVIGTWSWTLLVPLFAFAPSAYAFGGLIALLLLTAPAWNAVISARRISFVPDRLQGRVQSASSLFSLGAIALGTLAAGFLLDSFGRGATIAFFAVAMAAVALVGTLAPSVRRALER
jgi:MFS family permease